MGQRGNIRASAGMCELHVLEVADFSGNKLSIDFKHLIGLKIALVKFSYPKG